MFWVLVTLLTEQQQVSNAQQGAAAEERVFQLLLTTLTAKGWRFTFNEMLTERWDIDVVARSPNNRTYIIDVKSHGGTKVVTADAVYRRYGENVYQFDTCFLKALTSQAVALKKKYHLDWVTPLLCFTEGDIEYSSQTINPRGVVVVEVEGLIDTLLKLDGE